jgi:hypothetical protein
MFMSPSTTRSNSVTASITPSNSPTTTMSITAIPAVLDRWCLFGPGAGDTTIRDDDSSWTVPLSSGRFHSSMPLQQRSQCPQTAGCRSVVRR